MPKNSHAARREQARAVAASEGISYTAALRRLDEQRAAAPAGVNVALVAEDIPAEERGIAGLPGTATPEERARAEASWRTEIDPDRPCRCAGRNGQPCFHGTRCEEEYADHNGDDDTNNDAETGGVRRCSGRIIHRDRYPGSAFGLICWEDEYICVDCRELSTASVDLPDVPWGRIQQLSDGKTTTTEVFGGVRHPMFPEIPDDAPKHPAGDGSCRACGAYALSGFLCDGCRHDGWTDFYGIVEEPDPDQCESGCEECGADHEYHCVCI